MTIPEVLLHLVSAYDLKKVDNRKKCNDAWKKVMFWFHPDKLSVKEENKECVQDLYAAFNYMKSVWVIFNH